VEEEALALAMLRLAELEKCVIEGAGAAGLAALLAGSLPELKDRAVVPLLSGATSIPLLIAGSSSEGPCSLCPNLIEGDFGTQTCEDPGKTHLGHQTPLTKFCYARKSIENSVATGCLRSQRLAKSACDFLG
jgi:hypothetical protein